MLADQCRKEVILFLVPAHDVSPLMFRLPVPWLRSTASATTPPAAATAALPLAGSLSSIAATFAAARQALAPDAVLIHSLADTYSRLPGPGGVSVAVAASTAGSILPFRSSESVFTLGAAVAFPLAQGLVVVALARRLQPGYIGPPAVFPHPAETAHAVSASLASPAFAALLGSRRQRNRHAPRHPRRRNHSLGIHLLFSFRVSRLVAVSSGIATKAGNGDIYFHKRAPTSIPSRVGRCAAGLG
jgi:hypothetical protein